MLGTAGGVFWLWAAGIRTTFIRNGFERVVMLLPTGHVDRADVFIAAPAACVTGGLVLFSLSSYAHAPDKSWIDVGSFVAAFGILIAFFVAIFTAFTPQYLSIFGHLLGS
jgi:hypothetical protein